ncbi:MAG: ribosome biogenesis factor YjgA [Rhodocyclaceae bacterium]|nr:ribosome biogenesis factor YjgA [Rhodocyclaceae bacterium]
METDKSDEGDERPSKSSIKREMLARQEIGEALAELPPARLKKIDLPEALAQALRDYHRFPGHEAKRRQMQFIGRLMRDIDPAPIQAVLDEIRGVCAAANARQHALERLRARLLEDEAVLGEIAGEHPGADLQRLRQLRRNALKEQEQGKPPRAFRELFRVLRELEGTPEETQDHD